MTRRSEFRRRLLAALAGGDDRLCRSDRAGNLHVARIDERRRHPRLIITRPDGREISYWFPSTPSDRRRGVRNAVAGIRRLLKEGEK